MKKYFFLLLLVVLLGGLGFAGYKLFKHQEERREFERSTNNYSELTKIRAELVALAGEPKDYNQPTLVVFFNSECDHCQAEALEIAQHLEEFLSGQIWWISFQEPENILNFLESYGLMDYSGSFPFSIEPEKAQRLFGRIRMPQTMVFENNRIQAEFIGEVDFAEELADFFD